MILLKKNNALKVLSLALVLASSGMAQIKKVLITDFIFGSTHTEGRPLCQQLIKDIGVEKGFTVEVVTSESKITTDFLKGFDLVVWNSLSQNGLQSATTKGAWQAYLEGGGAVLALHASGDTRTGTWTWYMEGLLDALYEGHSDVVRADVWIHLSAIAKTGQFHPILKNQDKKDSQGKYVNFQPYTIQGESQKRWAVAWGDEWYKFTKNPDFTKKDMIVLLELDEFNKRGVTTWDPKIAKTGYHPMAWARENIGPGKGRLIFICTGHDALTMETKGKGLKELWTNAMIWGTKNSAGCKNPSAENYNPWVDKEDNSCIGGTSLQKPNSKNKSSLTKKEAKHGQAEIWTESFRGSVHDANGRDLNPKKVP